MADVNKTETPDENLPTVDELAQQKAIDRGDFIEELEEDTIADDDETTKVDQDDIDDDDHDDNKPDENVDVNTDDEGNQAEDDPEDKGDDQQIDNPDPDPEDPRIPKARLDKALRKNREQQDEIDRLKEQLEKPKDNNEDEEVDDPYDVEGNWDKYNDLVEDGEIEEAKVLFREIRSEERKIARAENEQFTQKAILMDKEETLAIDLQKTADSVANDLVKAHPELQDNTSQEFKDVMGWADMLEVQQKMTRAEALTEASKRVFSDKNGTDTTKGSDKDKGNDKEKSPSQRDISMKQKNLKDNEKQPPRLDKGSSSRGVKTKKPSEMSETEHENLTLAQKKALRGDTV